ncbi:hypothetical protein DCC39_05300 [Pueribacillus theae]|uniref:Uncharacterized protein n=1 Tax=Pueribacillus theae TaxID=2171751 RepID=A0A2U1K645_9BACI|nr:DUF6557 family protein [Pueribacillus theae]PWA12639.1 hypothetical protein DCC39_05300 [Pueribacillus theae]
MIFKELLKNVKFDDVWEVLFREYNFKAEAYEAYKRVMDELRSLEVPAYQSEFTLVVAKVENSFEPGTFIFEVFGMKKGDENRYALEMEPWENWMNVDVLNKSIEFYSAAGVVAHALYEMTFFGYSAEAVAKRVDEEKQILTDVVRN